MNNYVLLHSFYNFVSYVYRNIAQRFCFHHFPGVLDDKILDVKVSKEKAAE